MDDLLSEDWQKPAKQTTSASNPPSIPSTFASSYSSLRASPALPTSRSASPNISRPTSTVNGNNSSKTLGGDAFGSLLGSKKPTSSNVSMQERQKQLIEEKRRQQEHAAQQWDSLGSGMGTPEIRAPSPALSLRAPEAEDDIMAAFSKDAPVDKSSHFPPPSSNPASGRSTPAFQPPAQLQAPVGNAGFDDDDDDDPFGLGSVPRRSGKSTPAPVPQFNGDDDDILGDLGKPLAARPARSLKAERTPETQAVPEAWGSEQPQDRALAELVDMGFPADNARLALSENGGDVQGAVGWLLQQAHAESKQKARTEVGERRISPAATSRSPQRRTREQNNVPAWMREGSRPDSANARRQDSRSPANGDKDAAAVAQEYGTKLLKGATSLWKASQKQMAKTVADFQQERDPSQPRWMQDTTADSSRSSSQRRQDSVRAKQREIDATDEAAMLDAPRERPQKTTKSTGPDRPHSPASSYRDPDEPLSLRSAAQPKFMQQPTSAPSQRAPSKLTRQDVEDQAAQAYVSSARRRKGPPKAEPQPELEIDLFSPAPPKPARTKPVTSAPAPSPHVRPQAPPRNIPIVTPSALATSAQHRKAGGDSYKRGDYASAHEAYAAALRSLPAQHPLTIIVLSNRSMTALKTGDPKLAISDADQALAVIGVSQGIGETIDLGAGDGTKDMREFYGKALMRKAEALEHLEKWTEAAAIWRTAVEGGIGGAVSIRGRDRCEKTAAPKPADSAAAPRKPAAAPIHAAPTKSLGNSVKRPTLPGPKETEAVNKLRAQNAAAEKADDERFALIDQVDARLTAWKGGKADNLRALLQSLDSVLWESAGWKKVGMSDLVLPNKVKIIYMKAIAKVHPDKIAQDATTEQRMISAAVFSTLNEAWDKFKKDNNL